MKIVVNDIAAESGGALTVLKSFYEYVRENDDKNQYIFLLSEKHFEETSNIKIILRSNVKKSGLHKLWFDFVSGKKFINRLKPDYVLSLQNIITFGVKVRQGVYVHQSIPFQKEKKFSFFKRQEVSLAFIQHFIGSIIKKSVKRAQDVFVQTNWMKENVAEKCKVSEDKITVVPFNSNIDKERACCTQCPIGKFFYPALFESLYKNQECIYKAVDLLTSKGITDFKITLSLPVENTPKRKNIEHCGALDRDSLYKGYIRNVIVFPSYIETIGLPLLEARTVNSIIFAADCQYSREVLKGYKNAYFFNPFKPEELAELLIRAIKGELEFNRSLENIVQVDSWKKILDVIN